MIIYDEANERLTVTSDEGSFALINGDAYALINGQLEIGNPRAIGAAELVIEVVKTIESETIHFSTEE